MQIVSFVTLKKNSFSVFMYKIEIDNKSPVPSTTTVPLDVGRGRKF